MLKSSPCIDSRLATATRNDKRQPLSSDYFLTRAQMSSPTNTNIQTNENYDELIDNLLSCLGVSKSSFQEAVAWSLCEHMLVFLAEDREEIMAMRNDRDFFAKFGLYLQRKTGRKWSFEDAERI